MSVFGVIAFVIFIGVIAMWGYSALPTVKSAFHKWGPEAQQVKIDVSKPIEGFDPVSIQMPTVEGAVYLPTETATEYLPAYTPTAFVPVSIGNEYVPPLEVPGEYIRINTPTPTVTTTVMATPLPKFNSEGIPIVYPTFVNTEVNNDRLGTSNQNSNVVDNNQFAGGDYSFGNWNPDLDGYTAQSVTIRMSYYWPPLGGVNCAGDCEHMASGYYWRDFVGQAVACPSDLTFGTIIEISGDYWKCLDRGGLIVYTNGMYWIDFLYPYLPYGKYGQVVDVKIYRK